MGADISQSAMKYSLPDFADSFRLNALFVQFVARNPVLLQEGVAVDNVYGCFPNCVLNGGRAFVREPYTRERIEETFATFAEHGVKLRLTLTNMLAKEEHLHDSYANDILDIASNFGAEAIVYHDFVGDYVRERYGMKCVLSTTRELNEVEEFNAMARRYDFVVLNYNFNKDSAFIDAIEDKSKVEVMVNEYCSRGCPHRREHYLHNSKDQMNGALTPYDCYANKIEVFLKHAPGDPVFFTDEETAKLHKSTGIEHFKIVGRGIPRDVVIESYVYYLIKPEYREDVKEALKQALR